MQIYLLTDYAAGVYVALPEFLGSWKSRNPSNLQRNNKMNFSPRKNLYISALSAAKGETSRDFKSD
jgi:hypothetical protein